MCIRDSVTDDVKFKTILKKIPKLDILVNNAGSNRPEHFIKVKKENMDYLVNLNLKAYCAVQPPSTIIEDPVIIDELSEAKKATDVATSLCSATLPNGIFLIISLINFLFLKNLLTIGVRTKVGQTELTLILLFAKSIAIPLVRPSIPNFVIL